MLIRFFAIVLIGLSTISNQALVSADCFDYTEFETVAGVVNVDGPMVFTTSTDGLFRVSYTPSADTNAVVKINSPQSEWFWEEQPFRVKVVPASDPVPHLGASTEKMLMTGGFVWQPVWLVEETVFQAPLVGGTEYHFYFGWGASFLSFGVGGVCIEDETSSDQDICNTLNCSGCLIEESEEGPWKFACELPEDMSSAVCTSEGHSVCSTPAPTAASSTPAPTASSSTPAPFPAGPCGATSCGVFGMRGTCVDGSCQCNYPWSGADCSAKLDC